MEESDPFHSPTKEKWQRWYLLTFIVTIIALGLHRISLFVFEPEITQPSTAIFVASVMFAFGATALSEMMRKDSKWHKNLKRTPDALKWSFLWSILTPMFIVNNIPVPSFGVFIASLFNGQILFAILAILNSGLMVWLHWVGVKLTLNTQQSHQNKVFIQFVIWLGISAGIYVIAGPALNKPSLFEF